jgi:tRNA-dihydrouridine synthase
VKKAMKGSKTHGVMNGRALFSYNPELFKDDDNAGGADTYEESKETTAKKEEEEWEEVK